MKLTPEQVAIKRSFRKNMLIHWRHGVQCYRVLFEVAKEMKWDDTFRDFGPDYDEIYRRISVIPSIGFIHPQSPCSRWLAVHYPKTSNAMFDGATDDEALAIWKKEKRVVIENRAFSSAKRTERRRCKTTHFVEARKLDKKHDWNTVK